MNTIENIKKAVHSPEAVRILFKAISGKGPGKLISILQSPEVGQSFALSAYISGRNQKIYIAGLMRSFKELAAMAQVATGSLAIRHPELNQLDWMRTNGVIFIPDGVANHLPPLFEADWAVFGLDNCEPIPADQQGTTYVVSLNNDTPTGDVEVDEVLAILRGKPVTVTTELGKAMQALLS